MERIEFDDMVIHEAWVKDKDGDQFRITVIFHKDGTINGGILKNGFDCVAEVKQHTWA